MTFYVIKEGPAGGQVISRYAGCVEAAAAEAPPQPKKETLDQAIAEGQKLAQKIATLQAFIDELRRTSSGGVACAETEERAAKLNAMRRDLSETQQLRGRLKARMHQEKARSPKQLEQPSL